MKKNLLTIIMLCSSSVAFAQLDLSLKLDSFLKKANSVQKVELAPEKTFTAVEVPVAVPDNKPELVQKKVLVSPKLLKNPSLVFAAAGKAKTVWIAELQPEAPEVKPLAHVEDPRINPDQVNLLETKDIKPDEYKLIQALVFLQMQKKYDLALSLFAELSDDSNFKNESTFHYAESAQALELFSEFRQKMLQVSEDTKTRN